MKECKFCKSEYTYTERKIKSPVNGNLYILHKCKNCGSSFFDSKEHPVDLQNMYNDFVSRADFPFEFNPTKKWLNEKMKIEKLIGMEPKAILDVGCRTGDFLMHFSENIKRVGVELSDDFADIAQKRGLKIYNDFLENISFDESFDVISCYAILEHLEEPLQFLSNLTPLINRKGILVIMVPTYQSLKAKLLVNMSMPWHMFSPPEHLNFYSRKFLDEYLATMGLKKVSRRFSSGGMLLSKNRIFKQIEKYSNTLIDNTILSRFAIFDHMYTYYRKN